MVLSPPHHPSSSEDIRLLSYHTLPAHERSPTAGIRSALLDGVRRKECVVHHPSLSPTSFWPSVIKPSHPTMQDS